MKGLTQLEIIKRLGEFSTRISLVSDHQDLVSAVESVLDDLLSFEYSGLYLYDSEEDRLRLLFAKGFTENEKKFSNETAMDRYPGRVFVSREMINIIGETNDELELMMERHRSAFIRQRLFIPVMVAESCVGVFAIKSSNPDPFDEAEIEIVKFISNLTGAAYSKILTIQSKEEIEITLKLHDLALKNSKSGVVIADASLKDNPIIYVNDAFEQITGYSFEEVKGKNCRFLQGNETNQAGIFEVREALKTRQDSRVVVKNFRKNGALFWNELSISPIKNITGVTTHFVGIQNDITLRVNAELKLRESEEKFRQIVEQANDVIYRITPAGIFTFINQIGERIAELPKEKILGRHYLEFIHPEFREQARNFYRKQVLEKIPNTYFEFIFISNAGRERWLGQNVQLIIQNDAIVELQAVARDITDLKQVLDELIKARQAAEASTRAKDQFLSHMSHEIRTPMNAVVGLTHLLLTLNPAPEQIKFLETIKSSSDNLLVIINDILDFSKIEAGKIDINNEDFSIRQMLDELYHMAETLVGRKSLELIFRVEPDVDNYIFTDKVRLNQILLNLVSNAIKFTDRGKVELSCGKTDSGNGTCILKFDVSDTGIGISPEKVGRIFNSFEQAHFVRNVSLSGTGLGLAIVKRLVELQNGRVYIKSEPGKGSVFTVELQVKISDATAVQRQKEQTSSTPGSQDLSGIELLIVEDFKVNQFVITSILKQWNAGYKIANNGLEALDLLKQNDFDLILMDLSMPVMDGYEASKAIREQFDEPKRSIPIIALTASAMLDSKEKIFASGINDQLNKPFKPEQLYQKLIAFLPVGQTGTPERKTEVPVQPAARLTSLNALYSLLGDDRTSISLLLNSFIKETPEHLEEMRTAAADGDMESLKKIIHKISPVLTYVGFSRGEDLTREMTALTKIGENTEKIGRLIDEFGTLALQSVSELKKDLEELSQ